MNKKIGIISLALAAVVLMSGAVMASQNDNIRGGFDLQRDEDGDGTPNGVDENYERPMDGSNSPWIVEDERLGRFQERFDLTDAQMEEIKGEVDALTEEEMNQEEIRTVVENKLQEFGVEDPEFGGPRSGSRGRGRGRMDSEEGRGYHRSGNYGECPYEE